MRHFLREYWAFIPYCTALAVLLVMSVFEGRKWPKTS